MESTVVDSLRLLWLVTSNFVSLFCLNFFQRSITRRLFYFQEYWGFDLPSFCFFIFCLYLFWKPLSLKGQLFLLIIFRSLYHGEEQEGIHSPVHFHVLNLISGSRSYFPRRAQFTISSEAWGRGPSRRRWILLALSLLGQINALCDIWRTPSIPLAEWWKTLPGRLTMCTEVNGFWGGDISYL